jgi:hypothetical protein
MPWTSAYDSGWLPWWFRVEGEHKVLRGGVAEVEVLSVLTVHRARLC